MNEKYGTQYGRFLRCCLFVSFLDAFLVRCSLTVLWRGLGYSPYDSYDDSYDCGLQQGPSVLQVVSRRRHQRFAQNLLAVVSRSLLQPADWMYFLDEIDTTDGSCQPPKLRLGSAC